MIFYLSFEKKYCQFTSTQKLHLLFESKLYITQYPQISNFRFYICYMPRMKSNIKKQIIILLIICINFSIGNAQRYEKIKLTSKDTMSNTFIAVIPDQPVKAWMILMDGFGSDPVMLHKKTDLIDQATKNGILCVMPVLSPGFMYFGIDEESQQSLLLQIDTIIKRYDVASKDFYIGGYSIGGGCAIKYAQLAIKNNYKIKPKAVFAVDPPLDWERYYNAAKRIIRLSELNKISSELRIIVPRIEKEMKGSPQQAIQNYYDLSPYSFTDTTQRAVKILLNTPIMIYTEPDIQWWLKERGYDYYNINGIDHAAMINELQRLGNKNAILKTSTGKGYKLPDNIRHPHSWNLIDSKMLIEWMNKM
jgi:hypothetical protein